MATEEAGAEKAYVYILRCADGTLYTGWTNDLQHRFAMHSAGKGAKYTRGRGPLQLVYAEQLPDKSAALRREAAIKKLPKKEKKALCDGWTQDNVGVTETALAGGKCPAHNVQFE